MRDPRLLSCESFFAAEGADHVEIYHRDRLVDRLRVDDTVAGREVRGSAGSLIVSLQAGVARVTEASCAHRTCVQSGGIHRPGQAIVCIPNEMRIVVGGRDRSGIDSVAF